MSNSDDSEPNIERLDLDMSNPVDQEILRNLRRARSERLALKAYYRQLDQLGREHKARLKQAGQDYLAKTRNIDLDHEL